MTRDGKSEEEAQKRLSSQMTNADRVARADVVLCTKWDHDYTTSQVRKALEGIQLL